MRIAVFIAIFIATIAALAAAQDQAPPGSGPTNVNLGIYLLDLAEIDGADQQIVVDFVVRATWQDPRLEPGKYDVSKVWTPELGIVNERRLFRKRKEVVAVTADHTVTYQQRYWGTLSAPIQLHEFPLDTQTVRIELVSTEGVTLLKNEALIGRSSELSISDWSVDAWAVTPKTFNFLPRARGYNGVVFELEARRYLGFFIWKIILPLVLIVFMSWAVFWIDPVAHGPQIGVTITSMLTLMAYRVAMAQFLPNLPYLTRLDRFITGSTILVFFAMVQEVATIRMVRKKHPNLARRTDQFSRKAFPLAFALLVLVAFWL